MGEGRGRHAVFDHVWAPAPRALMRLALLEELVERLPSDLGSFLEIGPGRGDLGLYLAARFTGARGLLADFSADNARRIGERIASHPRLSVRAVDFRELAGTATYELVVACEVFEHIEDEDSAFRAVRELLVPGGRFLFSAPGGAIPWGPADEYAGHVRRYSRRELLDAFARAGFAIDEIWSYGFPLAQLLRGVQSAYYRRRLRAERLSRREATERSGSERSLARRLRALPVAALLEPFFVCQSLARHRDLGDGYVVLATRSGDG